MWGEERGGKGRNGKRGERRRKKEKRGEGRRKERRERSGFLSFFFFSDYAVSGDTHFQKQLGSLL